MNTLLNFVYLLLVTILTIYGDILLKDATKYTGIKSITYIVGGLIMYLFVGLGFYQMYKSLEFSTAGIIYSVLCILGFAISGLLFFNEKITFYEGIGIILAIISVILMSRFAN